MSTPWGVLCTVLLAVLLAGRSPAFGFEITNTATVDYTNELGMSPASVTSAVSFTVTSGAPLLVISKSVSGPTSYWDGDSIEFALTLRNDGDATAFSVTVIDSLPSLLGFGGSATVSSGSMASGPPSRIAWSVGDIDAGMTVNARFTVRALSPPAAFLAQVNDAGAWSSESSSATSFTVDVWRTAPGAPPGLSAVAGDSRITLSWGTPVTGRYAVNGYRVFRSSAAGGAKVLVASVSGFWSTGWQDSSVAGGNTYCYEVRAVDANGGMSVPSAEACAPFGVTPPPAGDVHLVVTVTDAAGRKVKVILDSRRSSAVLSVSVAEGKAAVSVKTGEGISIVLSDGTRLSWDTRNAGGGFVPNGFYTITVTSTMPDGRVKTASDTFALVRPYEKLILSAALVPNPAREGVWMAWKLSNPLAAVRLKIYNLAGELLLKEEPVEGAASYRWNLRNLQGTRVVAGLYIVVIEASDPIMGRDDRRLLRLGVQ